MRPKFMGKVWEPCTELRDRFELDLHAHRSSSPVPRSLSAASGSLSHLGGINFRPPSGLVGPASSFGGRSVACFVRPLAPKRAETNSGVSINNRDVRFLVLYVFGCPTCPQATRNIHLLYVSQSADPCPEANIAVASLGSCRGSF